MSAKGRYALTFYLLGKIGKSTDSEFRASLCFEVSGGTATSLSDLSDAELVELNQHLRGFNSGKAVNFEEMSFKRMQKKFFSICYDLNWTVPGGKLNYQTINEWLLKFGYLHKEFNKYTAKELPQLITQLENIQRKDYEKSKS